MAAPMAPLPRTDRRASLLRHSLSMKVPKSLSRKLAAVDPMPHEDADMGFLRHERTLSDRARALQEKKRREQEAQAGRPVPAAALPVPMRPRHVDLMESASQKERENNNNDEKVRAQVLNGMENMGMIIKNTTVPPPPPRDQSLRNLAYQKHLESSYGLSKVDGIKPKPEAVHRLQRPQETPLSRPDSDMSIMTADSMEVNFHMSPEDALQAPSSSKDRRPKLQVTVPTKQVTAATTTPKHLIHQLNRTKPSGRRAPDVSPPSTTTQQKPRGEVPARLSIVSPLSVVEMPKPRRPFSAFSLEDMSVDMKAPPKSAPLQKSAGSDTDDTGHGDLDSIYSRPSSTSSLSDPPVMIPDMEDRPCSTFTVMNPTTAGVFDHMPLVPRIPKQHLKHARSSASIRLNTNKPLPPEPGLEEVQPLRLPSTAYSRSSIQGKRKAPAPLTISRSSTIDFDGRLPNRVSSLRSKYTPADLDALDAAFVDQPPQQQPPRHLHQKQPSLEEAELELEAHLNTIEEDDFDSPEDVTFAHDPLQISRGPNHMLPSRNAPAPPTSININLSDGTKSNRKRLSNKPSIHVAMQMKTQEHEGGDLRKRLSAPRGLSQKANRILGQTTTNTSSTDSATSMKRDPSHESNWSSSDSPETSYDDSSSSPDLSSREQSGTPETDASSIHDPAFEEVKARLELLSPPDNASSSWSRHLPAPLREDRLAHSETKVTLHNSKFEIPIHLDEQEESSEIQVRRGRNFKDQARSLASIAMSEIQDLYAELPPPMPSPPFPAGMAEDDDDEESAEEADRMISADAAEKVLLLILQNLDNLPDLFATATVSRGFYRTFKRHELPLTKSALRRMSPAAWELREMSSPYPEQTSQNHFTPHLEYTPALYLQHYMRDMYTMIALKSMILIHCESFLRPDTITALAGGETERASEIDNAFWRVWTFCQIFGCGSNCEEDITGQMDWLRGGVHARSQAKMSHQQAAAGLDRNSVIFNPPSSFGLGNAGGLSTEDLYDMTEIWTCLGVLVRGFQGKRKEARDFGVFDKADITHGDVEAEDAVLEEWTYHLLTLAPPTVLDITSPNSPNASNFAHARAKGYTTWTPPAISRATFLKEAVSRIYHEKVAEERGASSSSPSLSTPISPKANITGLSHDTIGNANPDGSPVNDSVASLWRRQRHAAEIRAKRNDPNFKALPPSEDRPMSEWTTVLAALDTDHHPPVPTLPSNSYNPHHQHQHQHAHHRATPSESDTAKHMVSALVVPLGPQVRDPVDLAVERLVGMGFDHIKAKKALADTDSGNNINFDHALEYLVRERKRDVGGLMHAGYRGKAEDRAFGEDTIGGFGTGTGTSGVELLRAQQMQLQALYREQSAEHERLMGLGMESGVGSGSMMGGAGGMGLGVGLGIGGMSSERRFAC